MSRIKQLSRNAVFAWSPRIPGSSEVYLAAGTSALHFDASFSSSAVLEICRLDLKEANPEMTPLHSLAVPHRFHSLVWTPLGTSDGAHPLGVLVGGFESGKIGLFDAAKLAKGDPKAAFATLAGHSSHVLSLEANNFKPNLLASGGSGSEVFIWDILKPGQPMAPGPKQQPPDQTVAVKWSPQVEHILGSLCTGRAHIWDLRKSEGPILSLGDLGARVQWKALSWHPESATSLMLASEEDNFPVLQTWDVRFATAPVAQLDGHAKGVLSMDWCAADPDLLVTAGKDMKVYLWNPNTAAWLGEMDFSARAWPGQVSWCLGSPNLIGVASADSRVGVFSLLGGDAVADGSVGGSPMPSPGLAESFPGADFSAPQPPKAAEAIQKTAATALHLPQVPRWLRPGPCGARFSFGNRLVSFAKAAPAEGAPEATPHLVDISQVVTAPELVSRAAELAESLGSGGVAGLCEARLGEGRPEKERLQWDFLRAHAEGAGRRAYAKTLGLDGSAAALAAALGDPAAWNIGPPNDQEEELEGSVSQSSPGGSPAKSALSDVDQLGESLRSLGSRSGQDEPPPPLAINADPGTPAALSLTGRTRRKLHKIFDRPLLNYLVAPGPWGFGTREAGELLVGRRRGDLEELTIHMEQVPPMDSLFFSGRGGPSSSPLLACSETSTWREVWPWVMLDKDGAVHVLRASDVASPGMSRPAGVNSQKRGCCIKWDNPKHLKICTTSRVYPYAEEKEVPTDVPVALQVLMCNDGTLGRDVGILTFGWTNNGRPKFRRADYGLMKARLLELLRPESVGRLKSVELAAMRMEPDWEGLLTAAILGGDMESAVEICVRKGDWADAFQVAMAGGTEIFERLQSHYADEMTKQGKASSRLIALLTGQRWTHLIDAVQMSHWKELLGFMLSFAPSEEFSGLCSRLGRRMRGDAAAAPYAPLAAVAAGDVEALVDCLKGTALGEKELADVVEKVSVLRWSLGGGSPRVVKAGPAFTAALAEYASLVAAQGALGTAAAFLADVPEDGEGDALARLRDQLAAATGQARRTRPYQVTPVGASVRPAGLPQAGPGQWRRESAPTARSGYEARPTGVTAPSHSFGSSYTAPPPPQYGIPQAPPPMGPPPTAAPPKATPGGNRNRYPSVSKDPPPAYNTSFGLQQQQYQQQQQWSAAQPMGAPSAPVSYSQPPSQMMTPMSQAEVRSAPPVAAVAPRPSAGYTAGWNDPPSLGPSRRQVAAQAAATTAPAPVTMPIAGGIPPRQQQQMMNQHPPSGMAQPPPQFAQAPPQYNTSYAPSVASSVTAGSRSQTPMATAPVAEEAKAEPPLSPEDAGIQVTLDDLAERILATQSNGLVRKRVSESQHKLHSELYARLRRGELSATTRGSLLAVSASAGQGDWDSALGVVTALATGYDFSAVSPFLPSLKALLQTARQLRL